MKKKGKGSWGIYDNTKF